MTENTQSSAAKNLYDLKNVMIIKTIMGFL